MNNKFLGSVSDEACWIVVVGWNWSLENILLATSWADEVFALRLIVAFPAKILELNK